MLSRWKGQFYDHYGKINELQILQNIDGESDYDNWQELTFAENPIVLEYNYSQDVFSPLITLGATVNLMTLIDGQYTEFGFSTRDKDYKAIIIRDGEVTFKGYVVNELYEEPHAFIENFPVQINLVDGLNLLERTIRGSVGNTTGLWDPKQKNSIQDLFYELLGDTGLELDLEIQSSLYPIQQINAGNINESPFKYIAVEPQLWQTDNGYKNDKEILEELMLAFGCSVFQKNGRWKIARESDLNRLSEDFTNPIVSSFVYSFNSAYSEKIDTITVDEIVNTNKWNESTIKSIEKGIEAQNINLDWVQRPNFLVGGDFEDEFRGWSRENNDNNSIIKDAPNWIYINPQNTEDKIKASGYVSNKVLGWNDKLNANYPVRQTITIPPLPVGSRVNLLLSCSVEQVTTDNTSPLYKATRLYFGVYDTSKNLANGLGVDDGSVKKASLTNPFGYDDSFAVVLNPQNPFETSHGDSLLFHAANLNLPFKISDDDIMKYNTFAIVLWGYDEIFGQVKAVVVDKVAISLSIEDGASDKKENQVETFYGGVDKLPFRKKGEDVSISLGAPSNEMYLSTLYTQAQSVTGEKSYFAGASPVHQETYQTYVKTFTEWIDQTTTMPVVTTGTQGVRFDGTIKIYLDRNFTYNLPSFEVSELILTVNGVDITAYAQTPKFYSRIISLKYTSEIKEFTNESITSITVKVKFKLSFTTSGVGDINAQGESYGVVTTGSWEPIIDFRNLWEIEDRNNKDNQLCVRLLQSILNTRRKSVWKLKGAFIFDKIITPNITIFDKYFKDSQNNFRYMRPFSISTNMRTCEHDVELIEVVTDVIQEGENNG